ncbi:aromatic ring-hydroxylating oxygenase subunit alpha [Pseudonocardia acaciae]|uniref:aromatic ring-hydroxylating oxygenase subunit alpha n=1 Tax=Pseudonocardia acaciae TaxID=551276 RepID=UPI000688F4F0|nr:aromatic ring-hydroxylating dioxygenase subunit alpha [Pseudonocardia acaciae]
MDQPLDPRSKRLVLASADLDALRRPVLEASTLPPSCYRSRQAYEAEVEHIFLKEWVCVGRVDHIPNPGDYLTETIVGQPVLVVRTHEGRIRAHLNVCRHRGCKIMESAGTAKSIKCPYHGWMYGLDGDLRATPDFKETVGFDKADYGLHPVRTEVWEGFILVNLDPGATPFVDRVSDVDVWGLSHYEVGRQVTLHRWTFDLACNWKTYVENYIESYHVPWVHAKTLGAGSTLKDEVYHPNITDKQWDLICSPGPSMSLSDDRDPRFPVSEGLRNVPAQFLGLPVWVCYPGFAIIPMLDCTLWHNIVPLGPERMELTMGLSFGAEVAAAYAAGDERTREIVDSYVRNQETIAAEDNDICERQQLGLAARAATPGRFCKHEVLAWKFDNWVARMAYTDDRALAAVR